MIVRAFFFFLFSIFGLFAKSYVTYQVSGGRFGDHVTNYLQGKWVARYTKLPLVVRPFEFIDCLKLDRLEPKIEIDFSQYRHIYYQHEQPDLRIGKNDLLFVRFFSSITADVTPSNFWFPKSYLIDWRDREFAALAKEMISPIKPLDLMEIEDEGISIGLHYREGGAFHLDHLQKAAYPTRFAPLSFYFDGLKAFIEELKPERLQIGLFTDAIDREKVKKSFEGFLAVNFPELSFQIKLGPGGDLEDFFSLEKFTYLVHAESLFSINAARLGKCHLSIRPQLFCYSRGKETPFVSPVVMDMGYKEEIDRPTVYLECTTSNFEDEMTRVLKGVAYCRENDFRLDVHFAHPIFDNLKGSFLKKRGDEDLSIPFTQPIDWEDPIFLGIARDFFSPKIAPEITLSGSIPSIACVMTPHALDALEQLIDSSDGPHQVTLVFLGKKNEKMAQEAARRLKTKIDRVSSLVLTEIRLKEFFAIGHHTHVITPPHFFIEAAAHLFSPHPPIILR